MAEQHADPVRALVNEQAEDESLWFIAQTAAEAYLQQELRRLHAAIEANDESIAETILRKIVNAGGYVDLDDGVLDVAISLTDEEIAYIEALVAAQDDGLEVPDAEA